MSTWLHTLVVIAAVGSGLVGGVFFAFSTFVMPGLRRLPAADAVRAMQAINRAAVHPPLMIALFGTAVLAVVVAVLGLRGGVRVPWLVAGASCYLLAGIVVTIAANVPRNDRLDKVDPGTGASAGWDQFVGGWTAWNHVRAIGCLVSCALFVLALSARD